MIPAAATAVAIDEARCLHACRDDEDAVASAPLWDRSRDEPMREVRIHSEGFTDAQLLHDDKAQTIDGAVGLILVSLEVVEGGSFLVGTGLMDARQLLAVELISQPRNVLVTHPPN
jgi:hypothetical protein